MTNLVPFYCPTHGKVLDAPETSLVECRCGADCAPMGTDPIAHKASYWTRRRVRKHRGEKRYTPPPTPLVLQQARMRGASRMRVRV